MTPATNNQLNKQFISQSLSRQTLIDLSHGRLTPEDVLPITDEEMQTIADDLGDRTYETWVDELLPVVRYLHFAFSPPLHIERQLHKKQKRPFLRWPDTKEQKGGAA